MMRLEDACELIVDCPHSTARDEGKGFPLIRTPNIGRGRFLLENVHRVSESVYNKRNARAVPKDDDIILAREAPAGNVAIIKNGVKMCLGQRTVLLRPNKEVVNPDFLTYFLLAPEQQYGLLGTANGATVAHVNIPTIRNLKIKLPPLKTQERIGKILSAYDDLIENNQRQIKLLEEAAQRLYKEWFVDLRFPGHENTKITDGIPEGWHKTTLAEIAVIIKRGISPKYAADGKYTVINQKCIRGSIMDITESRKQEKQYEPILNIQDCDTVICSTGTGTLGRVGQIYGDYPNTTFDSHVTLVRAKENPNFMYQAIKNQQRFLMGMGHGSTNQQELYRNVIENVEVLLPDGSFLLQTEKLLSTFHDKIKTVYLQTSILTETRDRLLPKLMSGEIEHIS